MPSPALVSEMFRCIESNALISNELPSENPLVTKSNTMSVERNELFCDCTGPNKAKLELVFP